MDLQSLTSTTSTREIPEPGHEAAAFGAATRTSCGRYETLFMELIEKVCKSVNFQFQIYMSLKLFAERKIEASTPRPSAPERDQSVQHFSTIIEAYQNAIAAFKLEYTKPTEDQLAKFFHFCGVRLHDPIEKIIKTTRYSLPTYHELNTIKSGVNKYQSGAYSMDEPIADSISNFFQWQNDSTNQKLLLKTLKFKRLIFHNLQFLNISEATQLRLFQHKESPPADLRLLERVPNLQKLWLDVSKSVNFSALSKCEKLTDLFLSTTEKNCDLRFLSRSSVEDLSLFLKMPGKMNVSSEEHGSVILPERVDNVISLNLHLDADQVSVSSILQRFGKLHSLDLRDIENFPPEFLRLADTPEKCKILFENVRAYETEPASASCSKDFDLFDLL